MSVRWWFWAILALALLANGADMNASTSDGDTPLHNAALRGRTEIVALLLAHGADVSVVNARGWTALDQAVRHDHADIVRLLRDRMATKPEFPKESEK